MKKLLITTAATLVAVAAFAQGTVTFNNGGLNKISLGETGSASSTWVVMPTSGAYTFGLFYGIGATQPSSLTFISSTLGANSSTTPGVIASAVDRTSQMTAFPIPGGAENATDAWVQIKGWSSSFGTDWAAAQVGAATGNGYFGQTTVINALALGASTGPGAALWQTAAGTDPHKFAGGGITLFTTVPEPTTMALAGLGVAAMLIFRRRK